MKKLFAKLKTLFDAYKMYVFFMALLFGTNGAQMYANSEPEKPIGKPVITKPSEKTAIIKPVIIYKPDNSYCDKKLNDHENGELH